ncbi:hypothetical protein KM043_003431 [Ampulex compressa]|nr:hypothetical protein KM043_003431 [Ampulex compressa]
MRGAVNLDARFHFQFIETAPKLASVRGYLAKNGKAPKNNWSPEDEISFTTRLLLRRASISTSGQATPPSSAPNNIWLAEISRNPINIMSICTCFTKNARGLTAARFFFGLPSVSARYPIDFGFEQISSIDRRKSAESLMRILACGMLENRCVEFWRG